LKRREEGSVKSVYDELSEKAAREPKVTRRNEPRVDIGLLLMNYRDDLRDLWSAADSCARSMGELVPADLRDAVERLRPLYGERP
jgi:hypothetical protein